MENKFTPNPPRLREQLNESAEISGSRPDEMGVLLQLADGSIQSCNAIASRLLGLNIKQIQGRTLADFPWRIIRADGSEFPADAYPATIALACGQPCTNITMGFARPDGEIVWLLLNSQPLFRADESTPYAVVTTLTQTSQSQPAIFDAPDASVSKESEVALRRSEEKYQALFESIDEGFCIIKVLFDENQRPIDYRFLEINPAFEKHTGLEQAEGKTARQLLPNLEEHWFEIYGKVALTGEPYRFENESSVMNRWFEVFAFRFGEPQHRQVGIRFKDISDLKRAEKELRQKNAILNAINESTPTPIFVKDRQGRIIYANPATLEVLGKTAREVIGYRDCDLYPFAEDAARVMENDRRIMESGQSLVVEESPDGIRTFLAMKSPYRNEAGEVIGLIGISNDISDRVKLERAKEEVLQKEQAAREAAEKANRIKDEFLAVLSHELRTPLNPILGWSKLLKMGKLNPARTREALDTIERNANLQSKLIEDLLDVSRILQGKLSLNIAPVTLTTIIKDALETVRLAAEAKNIQIQAIFNPGVKKVSGDADRLQQVVWNLLSNAVKFTPDGGRIVVLLTQVENDAQIQVTDTGKGISPDFLPYVFERFRQEDGSIARKFGGLGLGLAIVRQLVELHGGTIHVDSPGEGQGATFTVKIPCLDDIPIEDACNIVNSSVDAQPLLGLRILVVDDDEDSRNFAAFVLQLEGADVLTAANAMAALEILTRSPIDLLVSDIGMPSMDGYRFINHIRTQLSSRLRHLKAIALTAYAGETNEQQILDAGFQKHLAKPVDPDDLVAVIRGLL